jgi:hypothetical protein
MFNQEPSEGGKKNFGVLCIFMHESIIVESSLIGKSVEKLIIGDFASSMFVAKAKTKLLTMVITHNFGMGRIMRCRKT